jgi:S-adenosylmethionine:tRNA ribosyltransferase-isomerase
MSLELEDYNFSFPKDLIALHPASPKDSAKLLVYDRQKDTITHTIFRDILDFIPKECAVFFIDTKVIKARVFGKKITGAKIELLFQKPLQDGFLVNIKGKVRKNSEIIFDDNIKAIIKELNSDGSRVVDFYRFDKKLNSDEVFSFLEQSGHIPLPPYIKRKDLKEDNINYQTVFAKNKGAIAAPTASLHFTKELFAKLNKKFNTYYITLHVGAGTFKPVECSNILEHKMHSEYYEIPLKSQEVINSNQKILSIGTTVTRAIEYYIRTKQTYGNNNLFLHPQNKPKRTNYLLTNFHLPKSTLLMLVSSFISREKTLQIYHEAIKNNYRLFSYGDAMLIL